MKAIFLLIALYTIAGKDAQPSGDIPAGSTCVYEQSGNRSGQMTAGNDLRLTIGGYEGLWLHSITLSMRSNTSAGAGELRLTLGESVLWTISDAPFSDASWAGAYSTEWVDLKQRFTWLKVNEGNELNLHIQASQNSLYLQSVAVEYSKPQAEKYKVSFKTYSSVTIPPMTEDEENAGVVLPTVPVNAASWQFFGWAHEAIDSSDRMPAVYKPGTTFHPESDCTLHAVYVQKGEPQPWLPTDDLEQDDYMIAIYEPGSSFMLHAIGAVENDMLAAVNQTLYSDENGWVAMPQSALTSDAVYTLGVRNDTLSIRHKATDSPVKLASGNKLSSSGTNTWIITPMNVESDDMPRFSISGRAGSKRYYLSYYIGTDAMFYFRPTNDANQPHDLLLYALNDMGETTYLYTSFALANHLETNPIDNPNTYQMQLGPYKFVIKGGKKYMQINE